MIDSHCHLADDAFADDLDEVVDRARAAGLTRVLCVLAAGDDREAGQADRLASIWPDVRFAVGVHPHQAHEHAASADRAVDLVRRQAGANTRVRAIGEIGLDYHYTFSPHGVQQDLFRRQVRLARELDLPIVIHTREAEADTFAILEEEDSRPARGIFHCFTGGPAMAGRALDLGFHVSLAGMVTFPRSDELREVARQVPAGRLLVETDCPFLAPVPRRGRRNEPAWVGHVLAAVARARGEEPDTLDRAVTAAFEALVQP